MAPWSYEPVWCELHRMYCDWHPPVGYSDQPARPLFEEYDDEEEY